MNQIAMRPYLDAIDAAALYARDGSVRQVAGLVVTCSRRAGRTFWPKSLA